MSRRIGLIAVGLLLISRAGWAWVTPVLIMYDPPQGQTTPYVGSTSGTQESRWFYKAFVVKTNPLTDGLSVTVHMDGATKSAPQSGTGTYTTANWDITTLRSPKTVYATCPTANQSGNATVHFKKNRQVAVWAPDYIGCPYVSGNEGPCGTGFDCSGFQYYMYTKVGYTQTRTTAQGQYNASTHVAPGDALPGDWIFFDWGSIPPNTSSIDHTGVYRRADEYAYRYMVDAHDPTVREQKLTSYYTDHGVWGHRYGANERY